MLLMDHLPECLAKPCDCRPRSVMCRCADCICDRLRACEQRVLTAAREAIETLDPLLAVEKHKGGYDCCGCDTPDQLLYDALAAIDALKETNVNA